MIFFLYVCFILLIWRNEQYELAMSCIVNLHAPDIFQPSINIYEETLLKVSYLIKPTLYLNFSVLFQCLPSEIEVKYKMAECYTMLKQDKDAIAILDGIPSRQRTPKVSSGRF